jgi:UPF0176 protein
VISVAALYQFAPFESPEAIKGPLQTLCAEHAIKGTILLAREGVNGTIAGAQAGVEAVVDHIRALPGCSALDVKYSTARAMPFYRMKVRIKKEIVTLGEPGIDSARDAGRYVEPTDWNAVITEPGTIVIDTRNGFEVSVGSFKGAVDPGTQSFSQFPAWFREYRKSLPANPKVAMFCTGGIRCEKSTAFLRAEGIEDVVHLKGGILKYLETVPKEESLWEGECFVFDERVSVGHGLALGSLELCRGCRAPLDAQDKASADYIEGVQCSSCASTRTDAQRARYGERQRQVELAEKRGKPHIGDLVR